MLMINLKARFKNKAFLLAMISAIVLLIQQLGFKDMIPANYLDVVNSILTILTMLGIVVDTSTTGISDQVAKQSTDSTVNVSIDSSKFNTADVEAFANELSKYAPKSTTKQVEDLNASSKLSVDIPNEG